MVSKTRKQKAGKYKYEGAYGCVYRPALHCKGNASRAPDSISKVQFEYQSDKEFKQQGPLEAIDPEREYFISATRVCEPDLGKVDPNENNIPSCSLAKNSVVHKPLYLNSERYFQKNLTNAKIVEYLDGGENLYNFKPSKTQYVEIFKGFENLLEGLVKLHAAGYVHLDIKEANTVVKENPDGTLHMRFIDFGFLSNPKTFHTVLIDYQLESFYPYWPLDILFPTNDPQLPMPPLERVFDELRKDYIKELKTYKLDTKIPASIMDKIKGDTYYDTYRESYDEYDSMKNGQDDSEALKAFLPTIDIYMLGLLMATLVYKYTGMREIAIRDPYVTIYPAKMDKPKGGLAGTGTEKKWTKQIETRIGGYLYQLLDKMMDPDFQKRPSAQDALEEYQTILPAIEELFTENAVHDILGVQGGGKRKTRKQKKSQTK